MKQLAIILLASSLLLSCEKEELVDDCIYKDSIKLYSTAGLRDAISHDPNRRIGDTITIVNSEGNAQRWIVENLKTCYID